MRNSHCSTIQSPRQPRVAARFPTIRAAVRLASRLDIAKAAGLPHPQAMIDAELALFDIACELENWSRTYKKQYGRKAVVDDFLRAHAEQIHENLTALDKSLAALERRGWSDEQTLFLRHYRLNLTDAWTLDFSQEAATETETESQLPALVLADAQGLIEALDAALADGSLLNQFAKGDLYGF